MFRLDGNAMHLICNHMHPFTPNGEGPYAALLKAIGDARVVMIGEMTHGTDQFYAIRAQLTKLLIQHKQFNLVAIEGDWPDTYRVNRYVHGGKGCDKMSSEALSDFVRFPQWMWKNVVVKDFIEWLRDYNEKATNPKKDKVGFYGLDLYSMFTSANKVIDYLEKVSKEDADKARERYEVLLSYSQDESLYPLDIKANKIHSVESDVVAMLLEMLKKSPQYLKGSGGYIDGDELFYAIQNARVVKDAEEYYRNLFSGSVYTWNLRDTHMCETLIHLFKYYELKGIPKPKAVVWAHNSHLTESKATQVSKTGEINLGHLIRKKFGVEQTFNVGFSTFHGTVTAAPSWGAEHVYFSLNEAESDTYDYLFHEAAKLTKQPNFALLFRSNSKEQPISNSLRECLLSERYVRMIGVQYVKGKERRCHYLKATLPNAFDVICHIDRTKALCPLFTSPEEGVDKRLDVYEFATTDFTNANELLSKATFLLNQGLKCESEENYTGAQLQYRKGVDYLEATQSDSKALVQDTLLVLYRKLIGINIKRKQYLVALENCQAALRITPNFPEFVILKAKILASVRDYTAALSTLSNLQIFDQEAQTLAESIQNKLKDWEIQQTNEQTKYQ